MGENRLLKAEEAARLLGVTPWRLYALARSGLLPGVVRLGGKSLRFSTEELDAFIRRGGTYASDAGAGR
jgi:excisionase family DNA binding protein